jgi:hypothetical protein
MRQRYVLFVMETESYDFVHFLKYEGHTAFVTPMGDKLWIELFDQNGDEVKTCLVVPPVYQGNDLEHVTLCAILHDRSRYDTKIYPSSY